MKFFLPILTLIVASCSTSSDKESKNEQALDSQESNRIEEMVVNHATKEQLDAYDEFFSQHYERHIKELTNLIAIPTLAMVEENKPKLMEASIYLKNKLDNIGLDNATVHDNTGNYFVTAEWQKNDDQPTVLFYGHFDVQPVNEDSWDSNPFNADLRDGKLYGRGATDDKGPLIALISALEAIITLDGTLPINVMLLLDGSEEIGSPTLPVWLKNHKSWISTPDYGINIDAMMHSDDQGLMWKGLRGFSDIEVTITSANTDLHSGIYGGAAPNSAVAAAKVISSLWNKDGTIAIDRFYDDLIEFPVNEKVEINKSVSAEYSDKQMDDFEISEWIGEPEYTMIERTWIRNSLDVTGFKSGYIDGKASVIPHSAWFRLMSRTGPGQDPQKINQLIKDHISKQIPWGLKVAFVEGIGGPAPYFAEDDRGFMIAKTVLSEFFGKPPKVLFIGGSIASLSYVPSYGGPNLVSFGFQRSDENFHANNEFMRIDSFKKGQRAYVRLIHSYLNQKKIE